MDWSLVALAIFGLFLAGIIKGTTGLGYSSCAIPFLTCAVGLKAAILLVVIPAMMSNIVIVMSAGHLQETLGRFWRLYLATVPGIVVGIAVLMWMDQGTSTRVLGVLIVGYAVLALVRPSLRLPVRHERPLQVPVGLLNGFFTGLTGSQVMPLLPYMLALNMDPNRLVQAVNLSVTLASLFLAAGLLAAGIMTVPTVILSVAATIPALAGVEIGNRARRHIPDASFRVVVLAVLLVMGLMLAARA
jgi:uncharacterized protein